MTVCWAMIGAAITRTAAAQLFKMAFSSEAFCTTLANMKSTTKHFVSVLLVMNFVYSFAL